MGEEGEVLAPEEDCWSSLRCAEPSQRAARPGTPAAGTCGGGRGGGSARVSLGGPPGTRESLVRGVGCGGGRDGAAAAARGRAGSPRSSAGGRRGRFASARPRSRARPRPSAAPGMPPARGRRTGAGRRGQRARRGQDVFPARGPRTGPHGGCGLWPRSPGRGRGRPRAPARLPARRGGCSTDGSAGAFQHYREPARLLALGCKGALSNP